MVWDVGKVLKGGRYTIKQVLKQKQLSITYLATCSSNEQVVIKTPNDAAILAVDFDKLQERFITEAWKLRDCQASNHIVKVQEPFQEDGFWCIPMEYIAGKTLAERNPLRLPEAEAIRYVRQVGEALGVIHAQGLIHRDVTPENIVLRSNHGINEAVLIDFGLVRDFSLSTSVTSTQKVTPFTAPELCVSNRDRGAFTDLYGLGAVLYALVTGQEPALALDRKPGESLNFPTGVSAAVETAIAAAMALKGRDRPASVAAWLDMLPSVPTLSTIPASASPDQVADPLVVPIDPDANRKRWYERCGLILLAFGTLFAGFQGVMAIVTYFFPKDPPSPPPRQEQVAPAPSSTPR
jgi:eukaryotic-like serine/threonine-protein kinase